MGALKALLWSCSCCISILISIPAVAGCVLWKLGFEKAGFILCLASFVAQFTFLCFVGSSKKDLLANPSQCWCLCGGRVISAGLIVFFIVEIIATYKKDRMDHHFKVEQVDLTRFELVNTTSTLKYSIAVSLGPKHKKFGGPGEVYYEDLNAWGYYQGQNFTSLDKKLSYYNSSSGIVHLFFQGQDKLVLTDAGMKKYGEDAAARRFSIDLTVSYSGSRARVESSFSGASSIEDKTIKVVASFKLKNVPLSGAASNRTTINGGRVL